MNSSSVILTSTKYQWSESCFITNPIFLYSNQNLTYLNGSITFLNEPYSNFWELEKIMVRLNYSLFSGIVFQYIYSSNYYKYSMYPSTIFYLSWFFSLIEFKSFSQIDLLYFWVSIKCKEFVESGEYGESVILDSKVSSDSFLPGVAESGWTNSPFLKSPFLITIF